MNSPRNNARVDRPSPLQPDYFAFGGRTTVAFARDELLREVTSRLLDGISVELVGPRASGRTELLRRVQLELSLSDRLVIPVRGIDGASPLEAARLGLPSNERSALLPRGVTPALLQHAYESFIGMRTATILIDDADLLDPASWTLLEGLHRTLGLPMATVTRPYSPQRMPRQSAARISQPAVRLELTALTLEETREVLESRLGAPLAPDAVSRIHTKSAGQPGVALSLIDAALAAGALREEGGVWSASSSLWSPTANATFEAMLGDLPAAAQDALEMLAIAGVTDLATAESLVGTDTLESLEDAGMVMTIASAETVRVAVNPPGIAEYFLHSRPSVRRFRLVERVSEILAARHADEERDYVDAVWGHVESIGTAIPLATALEAPHMVRMFTEDHHAHRLVSRRTWERDGSMRAAAHAFSAELAGTPDTALLDDLIARALTAPNDDESEVLVRYLRSRAILVRGGDAASARAALVEDMRPDFAYASALDSLQLATDMELGSLDPATEPVLRARVGEDLNGRIARVVLALQYLLSGQAGQALSALPEAHDAFDGLLRPHAEVLRGLALLFSGHEREAVDWATGGLSRAITAVDRIALAGHAYVASMALAAHSRFEEANDVASLAMRVGVSTRAMLCSPDRASLLLMSALTIHAGGASGSAEALASAAARLDSQSPALPFSDPEWRVALSAFAGGDRLSARDVILEIASRARARGHILSADHADFLGLCAAFDPAAEPAVRERVRTSGSALALAYLDARAAAYAQDAAGVLGASARLVDLDAPRGAAKYFAHASRLFRDAGAVDEAAAARAAIHALAGAIGERPYDSSPRNLTSREEQVVRFIAEGLTNGQIASRLVLSVRTVESHINRITRKTGASGRHEIARLGRS